MQPESAAATAQFLKQHDPDRYYASLVLPAEAQGAFQALCAFSADVASVREKVSQPGPGEIRLQWWDDALTGQGHGIVRSNPVADALLDAMTTWRLPSVPLQRLIAARRFDLYGDPMVDLNAFEGYAGETVSVLYQFGAIILNKGVTVEDGDAAGHLGVAQALVGHIRAFGFNAARGQIFLPWSVLAAHGVTEAEIFSGQDSARLQSAMGQFRDLAAEHMAKAEKAIAALPRHLQPAFASTALVRADLKRLGTTQNSFVASTSLPAWRRIGLLAWWAWRPK